MFDDLPFDVVTTPARRRSARAPRSRPARAVPPPAVGYAFASEPVEAPAPVGEAAPPVRAVNAERIRLLKDLQRARAENSALKARAASRGKRKASPPAEPSPRVHFWHRFDDPRAVACGVARDAPIRYTDDPRAVTCLGCSAAKASPPPAAEPSPPPDPRMPSNTKAHVRLPPPLRPSGKSGSWTHASAAAQRRDAYRHCGCRLCALALTPPATIAEGALFGCPSGGLAALEAFQESLDRGSDTECEGCGLRLAAGAACALCPSGTPTRYVEPLPVPDQTGGAPGFLSVVPDPTADQPPSADLDATVSLSPCSHGYVNGPDCEICAGKVGPTVEHARCPDCGLWLRPGEACPACESEDPKGHDRAPPSHLTLAPDPEPAEPAADPGPFEHADPKRDAFVDAVMELLRPMRHCDGCGMRLRDGDANECGECEPDPEQTDLPTRPSHLTLVRVEPAPAAEPAPAVAKALTRCPARVAGIPRAAPITFAELWDYLGRSAQKWAQSGDSQRGAAVLAYRDQVFSTHGAQSCPIRVGGVPRFEQITMAGLWDLLTASVYKSKRLGSAALAEELIAYRTLVFRGPAVRSC